jgi:hypothetical protein
MIGYLSQIQSSRPAIVLAALPSLLGNPEIPVVMLQE